MSASERLRALDGAATPGPWGVYEDVEVSGGDEYPFFRLTNDKGWLMSLDASDLRGPDAHLMATLRNALPLIAKEVAAAEELIEDYFASKPELAPAPVVAINLRDALVALEEALGANS